MNNIMRLNKNSLNVFLAGILLFINSIFICKYGYRVINSWVAACFISSAFFVVGLSFFIIIQKKKLYVKLSVTRKRYFYILAVVSLLCLAALIILPEDSQVSRLSAINEWLANLMLGIFPYHTSVNPSGFPGLFLLAFPFYLAGSVGFLSVFGIIIAGLLLLKSENDTGIALLKLFFLLLMPLVFYELIVRSELLLNTVLAALVIREGYRRAAEDKPDAIFFLLAFLTGIILSTRLIVWIYWGIELIYGIKRKPANVSWFAQISVLTFIVTLLPFLIWRSTEFLAFGPFSVQAVYLPRVVLFSVPVIVGALALLFKNITQIYILTGSTLFVLVFISFGVHINEHGLIESLTQRPFFDIGYFIFCVPFFLLSIDLDR